LPFKKFIVPGTGENNIIRELVTGTVHIARNMQYNNIRADEVHVAEGVRARIFGSVNGRIVLQKDSKLFIHGSFKGEIINNGGRVYLFET
jgi:hypothetical protein